jgi:hypothetical protein
LILDIMINVEFIVVGGTGPLKPDHQRAVSALLEPSAGEHPWPNQLPAGRTCVLGDGPPWLRVTLVEPTLVVEVDADQAYEHRWRHLTPAATPSPRS